MADEEQVSDEETVLPELEDAPGNKSGFLKKMLAGAFIAFVVIIECSLAYIYIPSVAQATMAAEESVILEPEVPEEELEEVVEDDEFTEVDLGQFSVQSFQPGANTTQVIDFHIYGMIRFEDESDWLTLFGLNEQRFRDQVIVTMRSSSPSDLSDPGLGLIKRKILKKTNEMLGKPLLKGIVFPDFSYLEQ